jgi:hypothetical protein
VVVDLDVLDVVPLGNIHLTLDRAAQSSAWRDSGPNRWHVDTLDPPFRL